MRALAGPLPEKTCFHRKYDAPYFADFIRERLSSRYGDAIYRNGKEVARLLLSNREILPQDIVDKMRMLLRGPIEQGIAGRARAVGRIVYGKNGTTNDYSDAWFVGFDEHLAVGVWVGRDDHGTLGIEQTGSEAARPIWTEFMKKVKYRG